MSRPMDGLTLVLNTSASKISIDISPIVFFLAIQDVNLAWLVSRGDKTTGAQ